MPGGQKADGHIYTTLVRVAHSPAGIKAAVLATNLGEPALSGVDPLFEKELGAEYSKANQVTMNAGFVVTGLMREMGYEEAGSAECKGCVAAVGTLFKPKMPTPDQ
jgi:hypothetical protein